MLSEVHIDFINSLKGFISGKKIFTDKLLTYAYGTDAGFYRLNPKIVIEAGNENEVIQILKEADKRNIPVTFRASGTSLSGQSISESVLIRLSRDWNKFETNSDKSEVRTDPNLIGGALNKALAVHNKKLGPDPASINSAAIGGIIANNASGMTSGIKYNSYNTIKDLRLIFSDGIVLDTSDKLSLENFQKNRPDIIEGINEIKAEIYSNEKIKSKIENKFKIKNTTGYGVNSFTDFEDPIEIIKHLVIGSEGTLAFISSATFKTVDSFPYKASSLLFFKDIYTACSSIPTLKQFKVDAAEIMDRAALKSVENKDGMPAEIKKLGDEAAAILVELSAPNESELDKEIIELKEGLKKFDLVHEVKFTKDPSEYKKLWDVRKGLFPSACKNRKAGTTVIIEDINFPYENLAEATVELQKLFKEYGYTNSIIWGHSLSGNLHFVITPNLCLKEELKNYENFMNSLAKLVIEKYNGSLKSEHGTGRNMAPFVEYEWGKEIYGIMKKIKNLFDPKGILNPGVIINEDPNVYLKNIKEFPKANDLIDKCIECGFCETVCPSKNLTLTPRQRITVYRKFYKSTDKKIISEVEKSFQYNLKDTCAVDGLCATNCPVDINTGLLIKELRMNHNSPFAKDIARIIANNFSLTTAFMRTGLALADFARRILGDEGIINITKFMHENLSKKLPQINKHLPAPSKPLKTIKQSSGNKIVYFPSCITRTMGLSKNSIEKNDLQNETLALLKRTGWEIILPDNLNNLCCGMPFSSKGFEKEAEYKTEELLEEFYKATEEGKYPVLFDTSPCSNHTKEYIKEKAVEIYKTLKIYDSVEFIHDEILPKFSFNKLQTPIMLHITCSARKSGIDEKMISVAKALSEEVIIPENINCCGFAGDRGFTFPELNKSALNGLKEQIPHKCTEGFSNSKTCEIGLSENSGLEYKSLIYLVNRQLSDDL